MHSLFDLFFLLSFFPMLANSISDIRTMKVDERNHSFILGVVAAFYLLNNRGIQVLIFSILASVFSSLVAKWLYLAEGDKNALFVLFFGYFLFPFRFVTFVCFLILADAVLVFLVWRGILPNKRYPFYPFITAAHFMNYVFWVAASLQS